MKFSTKALHAGQAPEFSTGAIIPPIFPTTTDAQQELSEHKGFEYSRSHNLTRRVLETCLAVLEERQYGLAFASERYLYVRCHQPQCC